MPQFAQIDTFVSQIFWLLVTFTILYILMSRVILPRISETLTNRQNKIDDDLGKAEELRGKAAEIQSAYEHALAQATETARSVHRDAAEAIAARSEKEHGELAEKLAAEAAEAEARIDKGKTDILTEMRDDAVEIVQAASGRLIGGSVDAASARAALDAVGK
ncbi:MAG: F0F1 ATP synthase subunit B' [Alphaproteobacteria bacterium]|nr:F0F1 ATP synthase subunit B' [Alphaproteobacteria bacterium]